MSFIIKRFFNIVCIVLLFHSSAHSSTNSVEMDNTTEVICNIIGYIWGIGGPLMTIVVIGASLLAIFGRMPWPALFALGVFCGVFFGAKAIIMKVMPNLNSDTEAILNKCGKK